MAREPMSKVCAWPPCEHLIPPETGSGYYARYKSPPRASYCSGRCRMRAYRERKKAGEVIPRDVRRARAAVTQARELRGQADEALRRADYWRSEAARLLAEARRLEVEAAGQEDLPLVRTTETSAQRRRRRSAGLQLGGHSTRSTQ